MLEQRRNEQEPTTGATAVEYALLVGLIAAIVAGIVAVVGQEVIPLYNGVVGRF